MNKATCLAFSGAPQIWIPESPQTPEREDQTLFLMTQSLEGPLPFPRPRDDGGSPREQKPGANSGCRDPRRGQRRGRSQAPIPQPPQTLPCLPDFPQTLTSLSGAQRYVLPRHTPRLAGSRWCCCSPALAGFQRSGRGRRRGCGEGSPSTHDAGRVEGTTLWAFKHPCWVGARVSAGAWQTPGRGSPYLPLLCREIPAPALFPAASHPSRVLTDGTGPHLALPRLLHPVQGARGPGVRPLRRLSCSPASWPRAGGHPGPAQTQLGVRGAKQKRGCGWPGI